MAIALPTGAKPLLNGGFNPINVAGIKLYCRAMLSKVSPGATVWDLSRSKAGRRHTESTSGVGISEVGFADVAKTGVISQKIVEIRGKKRSKVILDRFKNYWEG
jgi:hypothetical protein